VFVGSLSIRIRSDANESLVLGRPKALFSPTLSHLTVQIEKDVDLVWPGMGVRDHNNEA